MSQKAKQVVQNLRERAANTDIEMAEAVRSLLENTAVEFETLITENETLTSRLQVLSSRT